MIKNPFALLSPFHEAIDVRFFTREDDLSDDASIEKALGKDRFVTLSQVHGNRTIIVDEPMYRTEKADGAATNIQDLTLVMRIADCQPLIVYSPKHGMIGMIHAGWKGVVSGVIPEFFRTIKEQWGIDPADTIVCTGPSLCQTCAEFTDPHTELPNVDPRFFSGRCADLRAAADDQLEKTGVPAQNRERSPNCTKCMNDTYWSYRSKESKVFEQDCRNMLTICLK